MRFSIRRDLGFLALSTSKKGARLLPLITCALALALLPGFSCSKKKLISGVNYSIEPNLETVKVQLDFSSDLQSDLGGSFAIKHYGSVEVNPWTPNTPFNVGFRMNVNIVNDQEYAQLNPVRSLPSGHPLPINYLTKDRAMAEIKLKNEVNSNFDVYTYADISGKEWVGVALTFKFINNKYFPVGLSISQQFLKDRDGNPRVVATVFGPKLDENGNLATPGGISVFANLASLISGSSLDGKELSSSLYLYEGPMATHYETHPKDAALVNETLRTLFNANTKGNTLY